MLGTLGSSTSCTRGFVCRSCLQVALNRWRIWSVAQMSHFVRSSHIVHRLVGWTSTVNCVAEGLTRSASISVLVGLCKNAISLLGCPGKYQVSIYYEQVCGIEYTSPLGPNDLWLFFSSKTKSKVSPCPFFRSGKPSIPISWASGYMSLYAFRYKWCYW